MQATFAHFARELCGPGLNIVKKLQLTNGQTVDADAAHPFDITTTVSPVPGSWQNPTNGAGSATLTTDAGGTANFKWEPPNNEVSATSVTEAPVAGWTFNGARCTRNTLDGNLPTVIYNQIGANAAGASAPAAFAIPGGIAENHSVSCEIYNRELRTSTIAVDKVTIPSGRPESFNFSLLKGAATVGTLNGIADTTPAQSFAPVLPGTYSVVEAAAPNYAATSACATTWERPASRPSPLPA